jgi:hypothetical protein
VAELAQLLQGIGLILTAIFSFVSLIQTWLNGRRGTAIVERLNVTEKKLDVVHELVNSQSQLLNAVTRAEGKLAGRAEVALEQARAVSEVAAAEKQRTPS